MTTVLEACAPSTTAAENLARAAATPHDVVEAWLGSPGHRSNLLDPTLDQVGIGCLLDDGRCSARRCSSARSQPAPTRSGSRVRDRCRATQQDPDADGRPQRVGDEVAHVGHPVRQEQQLASSMAPDVASPRATTVHAGRRGRSRLTRMPNGTNSAMFARNSVTL